MLTISSYYSAATEAMQQEVNATPDDRVMGMEPDAWIDYLVHKFGMEEIVLDDSREPEMDEVQVTRTQRGYDIYTNHHPGDVISATQLRVKVPVIPNPTIQVIWDQGLAPNSFHMTTYPEFEYDSRLGYFSNVVAEDAEAIKRGIADITDAVARYNQSIRDGRPALLRDVARFVHQKRDQVREKHKGLDDLAARIGIKLNKKTDISNAVPTAPPVRTAIKVLMPPSVKKQERPVLDEASFNGILVLIDNQCRQFERTPQVFQAMAEEGLRDVMLSSLSAVFAGDASGESFQRIGKVDIHLRITKGDVFVAELKFWDGPASLKEVVGQLLGRLTWRDSYGVAVVLSRNAGFTEVLKSVQQAMPILDGFVAGTLKTRGANHFTGRFAIPADKGTQVTIHVLVYNLYVAEQAKRVLKRPSKAMTDGT